MPQFIAFAVAGAALYAGYRLIAKGLERAAEEARKTREDMERRAAEAMGTPKDLGTLEWDERAGVYRPKSG